MKEGTRVLVALALAIAVGAAIGASGNATALRLADGVAPLGTLWITAIRMTIIPLIVALIITGIASVADAKSLGRIGARTVATFLLLLAGMAAVVVQLAPFIPSGLKIRFRMKSSHFSLEADSTAAPATVNIILWY